MIALASLVLLAQAALPATFSGVSYQRPAGWTEKDDGKLRLLVAPPAAPGQFLVVTLAPAGDGSKDPAHDLEALAAKAEAGGKRLSQGSVQLKQAGGLQHAMLLTRVEQGSLGDHERMYELVTDGNTAVLAVAAVKGKETLAKHALALQALLAGLRPATSASAGGASAGDGAASPEPSSAAGAGSGIPYGPSTAAVLDHAFRPSGKGVPMPPPAIEDGKPVGLWWNVHIATLGMGPSGAIYPSLFLPDGTFVLFYRPGGPFLADLDGMRAENDAVHIGRYSVSGKELTVEYGTLRRSGPLRIERTPEGPYFVWDNKEYQPVTPLSRSDLVGTFAQGAIDPITFRADGTLVTTPAGIDAQWSHNDLKERLEGRWYLDGYLLALRFKDPKDDRVYTAFKASNGIVLHMGLHTRQ
jgi:hypothetical protein